MRVLVTYGSKMGGTAGLADMVADALWQQGVMADVLPAPAVRSLATYDAVIIGGALYCNRWHRDARRFVKRQHRELRARRVWLFSSGPLGDSEQKPGIPPVPQVRRLMHRIGARGHETFGGCLRRNAPGVVARHMPETCFGDWRDVAIVERWVADIVTELEAIAPTLAAGRSHVAQP